MNTIDRNFAFVLNLTNVPVAQLDRATAF
jgi:hypothetical protein